MTIALAAVVAMRSEEPWGSWPLAALFFVLFVLADVSGLTFEVRRQTFMVNLIEIPLLLGLFYLAPLTFVLTRVAAMIAVQLQRKSPKVKAAFNVTLVGA